MTASNGQKVIRAAAEAVGKPDSTAKPGVPPPSLDALIARALTAALSPGSSLGSSELASRIQIAGELVHVRGDLDSYQVHISTGAIFRDSDGQRVNITNAVSRLGSIDLPEFGGGDRTIQPYPDFGGGRQARAGNGVARRVDSLKARVNARIVQLIFREDSARI